jgi:AraC-like DNA-binding protein
VDAHSWNNRHIRYEEWIPGASLAGLVTAYWSVTGDGSRMPYPAVLPDGHVELVFNLGDPVQLAGPAYTGVQPDRCVVGPLSRALRMSYGSSVITFGVRFHPAKGAAFFGQRAATLQDKLLPVAVVADELDHALSRIIVPGWTPSTETARAAIDAALTHQLRRALPFDPPIEQLVDALMESPGGDRIDELAAELGISPRQLQRRFLATVGMAPKRFIRVLRFSRVWQLATMSSEETWANLAVDHGYADQAHMVREFRDFGAEPPTRQFSPSWYEQTEIERASGPAEGVRSVQDPDTKPPV